MAVKGTLPKLLERLEIVLIKRQAELKPLEHSENYHGRVVIQIARTTSFKNVIDISVWMQCTGIRLVASFSAVGGNLSVLEQSYPISLLALGDRAVAVCKREHWSSHTAASVFGESMDSILVATRK